MSWNIFIENYHATMQAKAIKTKTSKFFAYALLDRDYFEIGVTPITKSEKRIVRISFNEEKNSICYERIMNSNDFPCKTAVFRFSNADLIIFGKNRLITSVIQVK